MALERNRSCDTISLPKQNRRVEKSNLIAAA
jgi:hypothetical protein